jgi:hypothetical protein
VQCSFHKGYGFFPGTGHVGDIGEGPGRGYSVNVPFYVRLLTPEHQQWVPCANLTVIDAPDHQQLVYQFCCRCIMNILLAPAAVVHKVQLALEQHPYSTLPEYVMSTIYLKSWTRIGHIVSMPCCCA